MSASYLLNTQGDQTIETRERGRIHCLAYSHPHWYSGKTVLAADFGQIAAGDVVFLCRDSKLWSAGRVAEVANLHDLDDTPVSLLIGPVEHRFDGWQVTAVAGELKRAGLGALRMLTKRGFKQGAFCQQVSNEQASFLLACVRPSRRAK